MGGAWVDPPSCNTGSFFLWSLALLYLQKVTQKITFLSRFLTPVPPTLPEPRIVLLHIDAFAERLFEVCILIYNFFCRRMKQPVLSQKLKSLKLHAKDVKRHLQISLIFWEFLVKVHLERYVLYNIIYSPHKHVKPQKNR